MLRFKGLPPALQHKAVQDRTTFIAQAFEEEALYREALRQKLGSDASSRPAETSEREWYVAAMRGAIYQQLRTEMSEKDVTDDEMQPFYQNTPMYAHIPERVKVTVAVFASANEAARFAAEARLPAAASESAYRELYARYERRILAATPKPRVVETWDRDMVHGTKGWPEAIEKPVFAAANGAVVGPIQAKTESDTQPRHWVVKVLLHMAERNSFTQVRDHLRMDVYEYKLREALGKRSVELAKRAMKVDGDALAKLHLEPSGPPNAPGIPMQSPASLPAR